MRRIAASMLVCLGLMLVLSVIPAYADISRTGFDSGTLGPTDDGYSDLVDPGFMVNFYGSSWNRLYVNNNGNVTFGAGQPNVIPSGLASTGHQIIAPFFADVDTRSYFSNPVTYGAGTVDGRPAFGVNWNGVGYYDTRSDKLNKFQLVLIDRSDTGAGNFDFEFNYDQIQWETGGGNGLGGNSARAGYSDGTVANSYELPGSGVPGSFLDSNLLTGLIHNSYNSDIAGRYVFNVRDGAVVAVPEPTSLAGGLIGLAAIGAALRRRLA